MCGGGGLDAAKKAFGFPEQMIELVLVTISGNYSRVLYIDYMGYNQCVSIFYCIIFSIPIAIK